MDTLTKIDLTSTIVTIHGFGKEKAQRLVEDFFKVITMALSGGESVKISGFGRFALHEKKERMARNPKTNEPALVSARRVVSFLPSVSLKEKFEMLAGLVQHPVVSSKVINTNAGAMAESAGTIEG
jgi:integration host factor subunit alpha